MFCLFFKIVYSQGVLTSVTNSVKLPSWFGGKKEEGTAVGTEATESTAAPNQEPTERGRITPDKGSDGSSATGGADSEKEVRKTNKVPPEVNNPTLCVHIYLPLITNLGLISFV